VTKTEEHYIILKGDSIRDNATTLKEAKEKYNKLKPKKRLLDGRSIYKLVKEE
jgi:hypothetical protein